MTAVGWFAIALLVCSVLLVVVAEWPRLSGRFGSEARAGRSRQRQKQKLTVIQGDVDDDFAASVQRDLANLPVIEERDGRSRR